MYSVLAKFAANSNSDQEVSDLIPDAYEYSMETSLDLLNLVRAIEYLLDR